MVIEFLVLFVVAFVMFRGGIARGYYNRRKQLEMEYELEEKFILNRYVTCACGHGNHLHGTGGTGSCDWRKIRDGQSYVCLCQRLTVGGSV